jgi:hypothetical protein
MGVVASRCFATRSISRKLSKEHLALLRAQLRERFFVYLLDGLGRCRAQKVTVTLHRYFVV